MKRSPASIPDSGSWGQIMHDQTKLQAPELADEAAV